MKATLGTVTGPGVTVGSPNNATVTIADTDDTATVAIGAFAPVSVGEPAGSSTAVISQTAVSSTPTVVKYVLFTGTTAVEGTDYTLGDIAENEAGNNTVFGPQPLSNGAQGLAGFSVAANGDITSATTVPHVTINSSANNGSADVYAFYTTGGSVTIDIDNSSGGFDSFVELLDANGTVVGSNDNSGSLDSGSATKNDSFLSVPGPLAAGVYYVRVTDSNGSGASAGATTGADAGQTYKLHISADGTAGYAVIGAGSTSVPLTVTVIDDLLVEPTEVVNVRLDSIVVSDPQITFQDADATKTSRNATVSITDNDTAKVSATSTDAFEPATNGVYTFTQTLKSATDTVIKLVIDGSSTTKSSATKTLSDPADHSLAQTVTVTIGAGTTQATLTVPVIDSELIEEDELLVLNMSLVGTTDPDVSIDLTSNPGSKANMLFGDEDAATVDVDAIPSTSTEGGSSGNFTFFLSLPPGYPTGKPAVSDRDTVVTYTIGGSAVNGTDYKTLSGTVTIPAFSSSVSVAIDAIDDLLSKVPKRYR